MDKKVRIYEIKNLNLLKTFNFPAEGVSWACFYDHVERIWNKNHTCHNIIASGPNDIVIFDSDAESESKIII